MKKILAISTIFILIIGIFVGTVNAAANVNVSSNKICKGDSVTVTISFGQKVSAVQFVLNFDTSKLEYVSYSCGGSGFKDFSANTKKFAYAGTTEDLSSVSFKFKAKAVGTANVSISSVVSNPTISVGNGAKITITEKITNPGASNNNTGNNATGSSTGGNSNNGTSSGVTGGTTNGNASNGSATTGNSKPTSAVTNKPANKNTNTEKTSKPTTSNDSSNTTKTEENNLENTIEDGTEANANKQTFKNEETGIMIEAKEGVVDRNAILEATAIEQNDERYFKLDEIIKMIKGNKKYFDIRLLLNNIVIQPNGDVIVLIPIPEEFDKDKLKLYYIDEENQKCELKEGNVQGDYYAFETNHFSIYALVEEQGLENSTEAEQKNTMKYILLLAAGVVLVIAMISLIVVIRKKENN